MDQALTDLALGKIGALLGPERAETVLRQVLEEARIREIKHAQDLFAVGEALQRRGGVEGAIGSILGFQALLRGAVRPASAKTGRTTP
jgi:hypothetical protein